MKTAFLFPAFVSEYIGTELDILNSLSDDFSSLKARASKLDGIDLTGFSLEDEKFTGDELYSQIITYILSCSLSDALHKKGIRPDYLSGYSMGLYASLYAGGTVSFEDGLLMVVVAFALAKRAIGESEFAMGSLIGFTEDELQEMLDEGFDSIGIANTNSRHAHLVTGSRGQLLRLVEEATAAGALHASVLSVSVPYHAAELKDAASFLTDFLAWEVDLKDSRYPIVSCVDQRILTTPDEIAKEVEETLYRRINWMKTFEKLCTSGVDTFVECGAGKSLSRIARFLPGDYSIYPMSKLEKLLGGL